MKLTVTLVSALLCLGTVSGFAADQTAAPTAPAAGNAVDTQLQTLMDNIQKKLQAGATTEAELAPELKQFDQLVAAHRGNKAEAESVAKTIYVEATLYVRVLENFDKASELLQTIKSDFPRTRAYFAATELSDKLDLERAGNRIRAALVPGAIFPDFSVTDSNGAPLSVSKYKGKVVLVDFWATWCGPCVRELPNVQAAYAKYHPKGFEIVGVSLDDNADKFKAFVADHHMTWPQYFDGKGWENSVSKKYGVNSIPATYLIGADGKILAKNLRGPALEQELAKLLK